MILIWPYCINICYNFLENLFQSGAPLSLSASTMDGMLSRRKDIPDDLACFLQQQKQRQARQETTMRSFPTSGDMDQDKMALDQKKKRHQHEVSACIMSLSS